MSGMLDGKVALVSGPSRALVAPLRRHSRRQAQASLLLRAVESALYDWDLPAHDLCAGTRSAGDGRSLLRWTAQS